MMGLPVGLPVPLDSLTPRERTRLAKAAPGTVSVSAGHVVREAVAPVVVEMAVVPVSDWLVGLERAGRFAPFCARAMLLRRMPADPQALRERARRFGVGVVLADGEHFQMILAPKPFRRMRHTPYGWQFVEQVYGKVREQ
jgi:hypothetical protein